MTDNKFHSAIAGVKELFANRKKAAETNKCVEYYRRVELMQQMHSDTGASDSEGRIAMSRICCRAIAARDYDVDFLPLDRYAWYLFTDGFCTSHIDKTVDDLNKAAKELYDVIRVASHEDVQELLSLYDNITPKG